MKIKRIVNQSRRRFRAIYRCEHCNTEEERTGYDYVNFHENVIPSMVCKRCGRTGNEVTSAPTVPAHVVI